MRQKWASKPEAKAIVRILAIAFLIISSDVYLASRWSEKKTAKYHLPNYAKASALEGSFAIPGM
jgi:hypothetical protein